MRNEQVEWKVFLQSRKSVLVLLLIAMVSSTLYVVYLKNMGTLPSEKLQLYIEDVHLQWTLMGFVKVFLSYFRRYFLVWALGLVSFMMPISILLAGVFIFSYGFSVSWLYVSLGVSGLLKALGLFGLQGMLMMCCLLYLVDGILMRSKVFREQNVASYISYLIVGVLGCGMITCIEMLLNL